MAAPKPAMHAASAGGSCHKPHAPTRAPTTMTLAAAPPWPPTLSARWALAWPRCRQVHLVGAEALGVPQDEQHLPY